MTTHKGPISDPTIKMKPSETLYKYITKLKVPLEGLPPGIHALITKSKETCHSETSTTHSHLLVAEDIEKIKYLEERMGKNLSYSVPKADKTKVVDKILTVPDLKWLYDHCVEENKQNAEKIYFHELIEGSEMLLPPNQQIPRNPEVEKRCERLRIAQENEKYRNMTKNVDSVRKKLPEDTLGYQMKEMNKQLIAIFQFIVSVAAGFAFGFIGVEVLVGPLDFGFKLLLGIIFALIIALAELYFLAKKLSEDFKEPDIQKGKTKVD
ncbi:transmembrane protein 199 [Coccinella septempunctata]|uniref:transmembrane protein 199 n=1 Tax=Coccinella septempunctata TaxID=41139 RepID=UPI001D08E1A2|nr:transmembrane protein 199 [Coccinella septempunctata]